MKEERRSVITDEPAIVASPFQLAGVLATNFGLDTAHDSDLKGRLPVAAPGLVIPAPSVVIPAPHSSSRPPSRYVGPRDPL